MPELPGAGSGQRISAKRFCEEILRRDFSHFSMPSFLGFLLCSVPHAQRLVLHSIGVLAQIGFYDHDRVSPDLPDVDAGVAGAEKAIRSHRQLQYGVVQLVDHPAVGDESRVSVGIVFSPDAGEYRLRPAAEIEPGLLPVYGPVYGKVRDRGDISGRLRPWACRPAGRC